MKGIDIIEGALDSGHALVFFPAYGSTNPNFFSLKHSVSQGESSLKFQLAGVRRFGGVREQTNRLTHSLIDWYFKRRIDIIFLECLEL